MYYLRVPVHTQWLLIPSMLLGAAQQAPLTCADVASCRQAAIEAASREEFEAFHDLAWRAAQKGPPNDPELMYLLARAQSLSGRPGDALVMLRRLAAMGIAVDAGENDDFRRVRALAGWPEVESLIAAAREKQAVGTEPPAAARPATGAAAGSPKADVAEHAATVSAAPVAMAAGEEALRLSETSLDPVGLAYDGASRRFVVGDRRANKLIVADEVFKRVNDLIGAASAGFGTLTAVEIDSRRGDLWVSSRGAGGAASVHKLQLVSGRVLSTIDMPDDLRPGAFSDISIIDEGSLLVVDSEGSRLLTVQTAGRRFERPVRLPMALPVSIAPANAGVYVAHDRGLSLVDPASGRSTDVRASPGIDLMRLRRIRWNRGALIALQAPGENASERLVRIRLSRSGTLATATDLLDNDIAAAGSALTISRDAAYYVAQTENGPVIRRVPLR